MKGTEAPMNDLTPEVDRQEIVEDAPMELTINEQFIGRLEKAADLYQRRYLPLCLKLTSATDWINHGTSSNPKFSLQASGAEKLCNPLGINWDRPVVIKHERQDDDGTYYEYEVEGIVKCQALKRYGWFTGNCSSRDQFFNARGKFDEGDIRKAAFSNWLVNGVTRLAGIRNPTPELLKNAGVDMGKVTTIDYSKNKSAEEGGLVISEAQGKRLYAICKGNGVEDGQMKAYLLEHYGISSTKEIKRKDYDKICAWAAAGGQEGPQS